MSIHKIKRKSGTRWKAVVRDAANKQFTKTFRRKTDAEQWEREQEIGHGTPQEPKRQILFEELVDAWETNHTRRRLQPSTIARYEQILRDYIIPWWKSREIEDVSVRDVEAWFLWVQKNPLRWALCNKSLNHILNTLRTIFNYAVQRHFLPHNPCDPVRNLPAHRQQFDYWSSEEITRFLASVKYSPHYGVFLLALNTGLRLGEVAGLRWESVNLSQRRLTVRHSWCQTSQALKAPKSGKERHVPISSDLYQWLAEHRLQTPSPWVFADDLRLRDPRRHFADGIHRRACRDAGVRYIRFHDLRHTFASHFMMNGGDLYTLQKILGHHSITMTERYAHLSPTYLDHARDVVSFGSPKGDNVIILGKK